jgi:hypothetical protein
MSPRSRALVLDGTKPVTGNRLGHPPTASFWFSLVLIIIVRGFTAASEWVVCPVWVYHAIGGTMARGTPTFGDGRLLVETVVDHTVLMMGGIRKVTILYGRVTLRVIVECVLGLIEGSGRRASGAERERRSSGGRRRGRSRPVARRCVRFLGGKVIVVFYVSKVRLDDEINGGRGDNMNRLWDGLSSLNWVMG